MSSLARSVRRGRAFTLVELLLVVAVIVLLISMLIPALGRSRDAARRTICATRLNQCGAAQIAYTIDHSGKWMAAVNTVGQDAGKFYDLGRYDMRKIMKPWVGGFTIWNCPSLDVPPIDDPRNTRSLCYSGYKYWPIDTDTYPDFGLPRPRPRSVNASPPSLALMQDRFDDRRPQAIIAGWYVNHADRFTISNWGPENGNPSITNKVAPNKSDAQGANIMFVDGSTRWVAERNLVYVGDDSNIGISPSYSLLP